MADIIRILLIPVFIGAGVYLYRAKGVRATQAGVLMMAATALFIVLLGATAASETFRRSGAHGVLGHLLVIQAWVAIFFAIGIAAGRGLARRKWSVVADILLLVGSLVLVTLSSMSGYLYPDPSADPVMKESAMLRFLVLHATTLPALAVTLLLVGYLRFRRYRKELLHDLLLQ
jgi:predicted Na+-dependent transporter